MLLLKLEWKLPNQYSVSSQRNNRIKLTHYDETKKMAHDSQIVRAKGNLKLRYVGPANDKHQAPTNGLKLYVSAVIDSEDWPTVVKLKSKHSYKLWLG